MNWVEWGGQAALAIISLAFILGAYRLVKGPTLPDRVLALDLLAVLAIMAMACLAAMTRNPVLLDASLALGILAFISTLAFARFMEREP